MRRDRLSLCQRLLLPKNKGFALSCSVKYNTIQYNECGKEGVRFGVYFRRVSQSFMNIAESSRVESLLQFLAVSTSCWERKLKDDIKLDRDDNIEEQDIKSYSTHYNIVNDTMSSIE